MCLLTFLEQTEEGAASVSSLAGTPSTATDSSVKAPVGKAKATHIIMNSLITKQTQESIQRFEQQAGLRDAGYTPHKGLTTEETKYLRVAEALHVSNQCCSWLEIWLWFRSLQLSCLATKSDEIMGKGPGLPC